MFPIPCRKGFFYTLASDVVIAWISLLSTLGFFENCFFSFCFCQSPPTPQFTDACFITSFRQKKKGKKRKRTEEFSIGERGEIEMRTTNKVNEQIEDFSISLSMRFFPPPLPPSPHRGRPWGGEEGVLRSYCLSPCFHPTPCCWKLVHTAHPATPTGEENMHTRTHPALLFTDNKTKCPAPPNAPSLWEPRALPVPWWFVRGLHTPPPTLPSPPDLPHLSFLFCRLPPLACECSVT
eukprot:Hpha_TRINITY_DN15362_c0_g1::TRINITY_DN15362_c0_g1_i3::g.87526::m.87526